MKVYKKHEIYTMQDGEQIPVILEDTQDNYGWEYRIKYRYENQDFLISYKKEINPDWVSIMARSLYAYNTGGIKGFAQFLRNLHEKEKYLQMKKERND